MKENLPDCLVPIPVVDYVTVLALTHFDTLKKKNGKQFGKV